MDIITMMPPLRSFATTLGLAVLGVALAGMSPVWGQSIAVRSVVPVVRSADPVVQVPVLQPPANTPASPIPRVVSPLRTTRAAEPYRSNLPPPPGVAEPITPPPASSPQEAAAQGFLLSLAQIRALALANNKDLAVLEFAPQIANTEISAAEGVFRPVVGIRAGGTKQFNQVATEIQSLGSSADALRQDTFTPLDGPNQLYSQQLLRTGGRIESGVGTNYLNVDPVGSLVLFNPYWNSAVNTTFEQPLFRGRGPVATLAPIRVAQANHCQSIYALQASINQLLRDVESAYWAEYAGQRELAARETILRISTETWQREAELLRLGQGTVPDVAQAEEQMETYRVAVIDAQNRLALAQRELRRVVGLHPGDPRILCSAEMPPALLDDLDFNAALAAAMNRPELLAQQQAIQAANVEVERTRNLLAPDVAVRLGHSSTGLDNRLDQSIGHMWGRFNTWSAGIVFRRSLGQPIEQSAHRRATLAASREQAQYANVEQRIHYELDAAYRNLTDTRRMLDVQGRRREAAARQLEARRALYLEGRATLLAQLDAETRYATDVIEEISTMLNYQRALANWNYARGAFLHEAVTFTDERLPAEPASAPLFAPLESPPLPPTPAPPQPAPPHHSPTR